MEVEIREIRKSLGLSQQKFGDYFGIPMRTLQRWEYKKSEPPEYVLDMIKRILILEGKING